MMRNEFDETFKSWGLDEDSFLCAVPLEPPKQCETAFELSEKVAEDSTNLQIKNFKLQKGAILKYLEENNVQLGKEEETLMEKTAQLNEMIEKSKADLMALESQIKDVESKLSSQRCLAQNLESQKKHLLSEKDKAVESLEKTRKAYKLAVSLYERFLGISVTIDRSDPDRLYITFLPPVRSHLSQRKLVILRLDEGYQLSDGTTLASQIELMTCLVEERRQWLSS